MIFEHIEVFRREGFLFLTILIAIVVQNDIELPLMVSRFFAAGISTILIIGYC